MSNRMVDAVDPYVMRLTNFWWAKQIKLNGPLLSGKSNQKALIGSLAKQVGQLRIDGTIFTLETNPRR